MTSFPVQDITAQFVVDFQVRWFAGFSAIFTIPLKMQSLALFSTVWPFMRNEMTATVRCFIKHVECLMLLIYPWLQHMVCLVAATRRRTTWVSVRALTYRIDISMSCDIYGDRPPSFASSSVAIKTGISLLIWSQAEVAVDVISCIEEDMGTKDYYMIIGFITVAL